MEGAWLRQGTITACCEPSGCKIAMAAAPKALGICQAFMRSLRLPRLPLTPSSRQCGSPALQPITKQTAGMGANLGQPLLSRLECALHTRAAPRSPGCTTALSKRAFRRLVATTTPITQHLHGVVSSFPPQWRGVKASPNVTRGHTA